MFSGSFHLKTYGTSTSNARSAAMPRYYFNVHFNDGMQRDYVGLELPSLDDAVAQADQARDEIMDEDRLDQLWFEIMDRTGRFLAKVG